MSEGYSSRLLFLSVHFLFSPAFVIGWRALFEEKEVALLPSLLGHINLCDSLSHANSVFIAITGSLSQLVVAHMY